MRTLDLDTRLEKLTEQYAAARDVLTAHPQFADYRTLTDVPDDLGRLVGNYETALQNLQRAKIPVASIVPERKRTPSSTVSYTATDPIVLTDIVLYDAAAKSWRTYKKISLDNEAAKDESGIYLNKTQDEWVNHWKTRGRVLPSLPLWYAIIERLHESKHPGLAGVIKDLKENWLATSTRLDYNGDTIAHGYGFITEDSFFSTDTFSCPIPEGDHWLKDILRENRWCTAIQSLLLCKDVDKAVSVLQEAVGVPPYIWTTPKGTRKSHPHRAVWLDVSTVRLDLGCYYSLTDRGRSRSVALESARSAARENMSFP